MTSTLAGKYEILRRIGAGGMGIVYEGRRIEDGAAVAIKQLPAIMMTKDDPRLPRFHREARAAASIDSEHVTRILETGEDPETGVPFIVMELLKGEDLEGLLGRVKMLSPETALKIAGQVCRGLGVAHAARVVHRDIKPANLFLSHGADGKITVKILDFGIAKTKAEPGTDTTGVTRSGSMLGSPLYMSPEQARGIKEIDYRTDLWSLGVVLYRTLCGSAPNEGISAFGDLIMAICSRAAEPVQVRAPWVAPEIAAILHKALRIEPEKRFQSAEEMLEAMQALIPDGFELTEETLGPVPESLQTSVAPRYEITTEPGARRLARETPELVDGTADTVEADVQRPRLDRNMARESTSTVDPAAVAETQQHEAASRRGPRPLLLAAALVGFGVVAVIARSTNDPSSTASGRSGDEQEAVKPSSAVPMTSQAPESRKADEQAMSDDAAIASSMPAPSVSASASAGLPATEPAPSFVAKGTPRIRPSATAAPPAVTPAPPVKPTSTVQLKDKFE